MKKRLLDVSIVSDLWCNKNKSLEFIAKELKTSAKSEGMADYGVPLV